jgi:ParB/RepB/Spo0J family partition protein
MRTDLERPNPYQPKEFDMALGEVKSKKGSKHRDGKRQSRRQNGNPALPTLERIAVEEVEVVGKHRAIDPAKVKSLAASMAKIGLRTPITVRRIEKDLDTEILLVAGLYRLEAAKKLGWEHIDAFVMEGTKADARMWQLMENLYRADLTALQRAAHVAELVQLVLDDAEGAQVAPPGGKQPHDRGIKKAAKTLGYSRDEIRQSLKIDGISEAAKTKAKELASTTINRRFLKSPRKTERRPSLGCLRESSPARPLVRTWLRLVRRILRKRSRLSRPPRMHRAQMSGSRTRTKRKSPARGSHREMRTPIPTGGR